LFNAPEGIWGDGAGNLYVGDTANHVVRKVVIATGAVTTVAGTPGTSGTTASTLSGPIGVWGDGAGNLYVATSDRVRKVVIATGVISDFAGGGSENFGIGGDARLGRPELIFGYPFPGGTRIIVPDTSYSLIRWIHLTSGAVAPLVGFDDEFDLQDGTGFTPESGDEILHSTLSAVNAFPPGYVIQRFNPTVPVPRVTVPVTVVAPPTLTSVAADSGAPGQAVAVTLTGSGFVSGGTTVTVGGSGVTVSNVTVGSATQLTATFTVDAGAPIAARNVTVSTVAGTSAPRTFNVVHAAPAITALNPLSALQGSTVQVTITGTGFTGTSVTATGGAVVSAFTVDSLTQITAALVLSTGLNSIDLAVTTEGGTSNVMPFSVASSGVADGGFHATTFAGDPASGSDDGVGTAARFNFPDSIWGDGMYLYVSDTSNHTIRRINLSTKEVTTLAGTAGASGHADGSGPDARFSHPEGLWGDGRKALFVADTGNHRIRKIDLTTSPVTVTTIAGSGAEGHLDSTGTDAQFNDPHGLWGDGRGNLFVADKDNHVIRKIILDGTYPVTTFVGIVGDANHVDTGGPGDPKLNLPLGLWGDGNKLYISEGGNAAIRSVVLDYSEAEAVSGTVGTLSNSETFLFPHGLWGDGTHIYVADSARDTIIQVDMSTGATMTVAGSGAQGFVNGYGTSSGFGDPLGVWGDGTNLYVVEGANNQVRRLDQSFPEPIVIEIDSAVHLVSGGVATGPSLALAAGTYTATVLEGSGWSHHNGDPQTFHTAWIACVPAGCPTGTSFVVGGVWGPYDSAQQAYAAIEGLPSSVKTFTLEAADTLTFYVGDNVGSDNVGSVRLEIRVSGP
jgi:sugar lactone lactonase YvrE